MTAAIASPSGPIAMDGTSTERALGWYRGIALIRAFESRGEELVTQGRLVGGMHSARGQEATAVGIMDALRPDDVVTATHRSHHVVLARGVPTRDVMAELMGKVTGCAGGRGGHMHLVDIGRSYYGSNAIVGVLSDSPWE